MFDFSFENITNIPLFFKEKIPTRRELRAMMMEVAKILRSNFGSNLTKNIDIEDRPFAPRKRAIYKQYKKKRPREKRELKKMLTGFRKYINRKMERDGFQVGIMGKGSGLANLHNSGLEQKFHRKNGDIRMVEYPKRQFIGYGAVQEELLNKEIEVFLKRKMKK